MNKLYKRNELLFALCWIGVYVVGLSIADGVSEAIGLQKSITVVACLALSGVLLGWMRKNGLTAHYGLCKPTVPASRLLYYAPLAVLVSVNLWYGVVMQLSPVETALYIVSMLLVGLLEELIFRGLLFRAMSKDNVKTAVIVSSVTFGIGHIVNLLNGAALLSNLLQVVYAVAAGFLFTILFIRTGSLLACIATHSALNALSVFANEAAQTPAAEILTALALTVVSILYALYILKHTGAKQASPTP